MAVTAPSLEGKVEQARRLAPTSLVSHAWLLHRDDRDQRITAAAHHQMIAAHLQAADQFPYVVIVCPPGYAKDLAVETPVLTTTGWKNHGDLAAGDEVFAPDGRPVSVLGTQHWGVKDCHRVNFSNGTEILAGGTHDWDVLCDREEYRDGRRGLHLRQWERLETAQLLNGQRRPPAIPVAEALCLPTADLAIDPYVLGLWLGDGLSASGRICVGYEDLAHLSWLGRVSRKDGAALVTVEGLTTRLRAQGLLNAKHIPTEYLLADANQRLALLQGLMDSDGTISAAGQATFCTIKSHLAHQVRSLVCSLGMKASIMVGDATLNGRWISESYRVSFHPHQPVFRLPRKLARVQPTTIERTRRLFVTDVERVVDAETNCIMVEGGRYLAGESLIPTHNSTWGSIIYPAWKLGATRGKIRMGLISNTATQAEGFAKAIQQVVETEEYIEAFPETLRDPARKWTNREMYFTNTPQGSNPGLMAMGMDGPILGKRFDEIIIDDPSTWDQVRSEAVMEQQRNKLLNTIIQRFPAGSRPPHGDGKTRMVVLMTRYGERDLLPTFKDLGFHVVHMPALGYWDRLVTCSECGKRTLGKTPCEHDPAGFEVEWGQTALWPEKEPRLQLLTMAEHDDLIFQLVYQGNTSVLSGDVFDPEWFRRVEQYPPRFDMVVMGVDTAGGRDRKKNDYTAIVVLGLRGDNVYILHAWRDRLSAPEQERKIRSTYEAMSEQGWRPEMVYVEDKNEGRAVYDHLIVESRMPLKAVSPTTDKEFRAIPISNAYRRGGVWHPENASWVRPLEAELEAFPEGAHDDFVDAMTLAYNETEGGGSHGPRLRVLG